jgi:hypothetical protein
MGRVSLGDAGYAVSFIDVDDVGFLIGGLVSKAFSNESGQVFDVQMEGYGK